MAIFTYFWLYDFILIIGSVLATLHVYFSHKFKFWKKRNVPMPSEPKFLFGHFAGMQFTRSIMDIIRDMYIATDKQRYFGAYVFGTPVFFVRDLELVKNVLVKDFSSFHDRGFFEVDIDKNPLAGHLFMMKGQEWRNLRVKLTPTFTTGKMRMMFPTLKDVGTELVNVLNKRQNDSETDLKEYLSRYTTDVISSCAFGIETNCLNNPDAEFRKYGDAIARPDIYQIMTNFTYMLAPGLANFLQLPIFSNKVTNFFINVVRDTMQYRTENNVQRNDFLQLLMQLKDKGVLPDVDNPVKNDDPETLKKFTIEQATAQAFIFFFAGFEPSSSTMQFALYELALNPELQSTVRQEIDNVIAKHNGQFTYDAMQAMELLDRVVAETLRKYPVTGLIFRQCNEDYAIPNSDVVLKKGQDVWLPLYGIQTDPEIYPEPEKFDPDRFLSEEKAKRNPYAYFPFGEGPRNCIGNRFALMQAKVGLVMILANFSISPSAKTPIPIVLDPQANVMQPKGQLYLNVSKR